MVKRANHYTTGTHPNLVAEGGEKSAGLGAKAQFSWFHKNQKVRKFARARNTILFLSKQ